MAEKRLTSYQVIILGFLGIILLGSLLLSLPFATRQRVCAPYSDALFTAVSAVCVTGLVVQDTGTYWSGFGQGVILALIQIGGLGVVTGAWSFYLLAGRPISLKQRSTMQDAISAPQVGGIVRLTGFLLKGVLLIELLGSIVLCFVFGRQFGLGRGIWMGVFHSISAFCNAGFDLMGGYTSLSAYRSNPAVVLTVCCLILVGGLGFLTWADLKSCGWHVKRYRMQTKIILVSTLLLVVMPAVLFAALEFHDLHGGERVLAALFQAVTPRTAGFNTVDLQQMSQAGQGLIILLMLIGGAPGSTAGGMKLTSAAVLLSTAWSVCLRKEHTQFFGRRVQQQTVRTALTIGLLYLSMFLFGGLILSRAEGLPLLPCLFETASAIGTVGLSLGLTPGLGSLSRIILMLLMFVGRVGSLTLIYAALSGTRSSAARLPEEVCAVG